MYVSAKVIQLFNTLRSMSVPHGFCTLESRTLSCAYQLDVLDISLVFTLALVVCARLIVIRHLFLLFGVLCVFHSHSRASHRPWIRKKMTKNFLRPKRPAFLKLLWFCDQSLGSTSWVDSQQLGNQTINNQRWSMRISGKQHCRRQQS